MTVTVLMAVRNGLPYVEEAVESVLRQTFQDFELVIVEDASTDGTRQRLRAFTDPRIRLVCNDSQQGQTRSLNRGLELAKGCYVARIDADDICLPQRLETQVRFLDENPPIAVAASRWIGLSPSGKPLGTRGNALSDDGSFLGRLLCGDCPLYQTTVMFRKEAVEQAGGYDAAFKIGQDYDLWARMAVKGFRAVVLDTPLVFYRFHSRQQSVADRPAHQDELFQAHRRLLGFFYPQEEPVRRVALLLRLDDRFWKECGSKDNVAGCVKTVEEILERTRTQLRLTDREFQVIQRLVRKRIAWGVRGSESLVRLPAWLFYGVVGFFSPLLIPRFHQTASLVAARVRREQMAICRER